jgi:hypothetical protein
LGIKSAGLIIYPTLFFFAFSWQKSHIVIKYTF